VTRTVTGDDDLLIARLVADLGRAGSWGFQLDPSRDCA